MSDTETVLGRSLPTSRAAAKVTGTVEFADDVRFHNLLTGGVLRSPYPHARITNIDISDALTVPGVAAIITGRDVGGQYGPAITDQPILAREVVRYAGDAVAAVAARDAAAAAEALARVRVSYEMLPVLCEAREAMQADAPLVHPDLGAYQVAPGVFPVAGTNICNHFKLRKGDVEKTLAAAAHVFTHTFTTQKTQHASIEPHVATAQVDGCGHLRVWSNTQTPFVTRAQLAKLFGLSVNRVQVIVMRPGGGFGGKAYTKLEPLAAALAFQSGNRPVRIVQSREEEFCGTTVTRHPTEMQVTTGLNDQGKILARRVELVLNTGAYADNGPRICRNAGFSSPGPYEIDHITVDSYLVYTNTVPSSQMRGFGIPQVTWAIESHTDMIAHELGLDPLKLRLENCAREGSISATGQVLHSVGVKDTLELAAQKIGLDKPRPAGIGRGIACGHKSSVTPAASTCFIRVNEDGTIQLLLSTVDMGQGSDTVLAQIAAEALGIDPGRITIASPDTDVTPYDMATVSSRSTFFMGNAIRDAVENLKQKIFDITAELLEVDPRDLVYEKGRVHVVGSPSVGFDLREIPQGGSYYAGAVHAGQGRPLIAEGTYTVRDATPLDADTGQGANPSVFWMYFSQAVEVALDLETGRIRILRIASAHDVGRTINPLLIEGQIQGCCTMGIGEALYEEMLQSGGQVINPDFLTYRLPTFLEIPEIISLPFENPHREGPFGAKGIGEVGAAAVAAAIANAVYDAAGIRVTSLPITPEKILQALADKKKKR